VFNKASSPKIFFITVKRALNVCLVLIFCFMSLGCDALYRLLDKEGAEEKALVGEVVPFEKNPTVEEIQKLLKLYGYNPGEVDGAFGLRTRNAIVKFQKDTGLAETRFADKETWAKLNAFKDNQLVVENQLNVSLIQEALIKAEFDPGTVDGKLGPKSIRAIKAFQKKFELKVDGKIGYQTLNKLAEFLDAPTNP